MFTDVKQVQSYIKSVANSVKLVVLDANLSVKVLRSAIQECNSSKVDSKCTNFLRKRVI